MTASLALAAFFGLSFLLTRFALLLAMREIRALEQDNDRLRAALGNIVKHFRVGGAA